MADSASSDPAVDQAVAKVEAARSAGQITAGGATNLTDWITQPQYAAYRAKLLKLVEAGSFKELDRLFWEVIPFGTGGRRGLMAELGSATMNDRTVAESADGMAAYLEQVKGAAGGRAVVAHDTRNRSPEFARIAATTFAAHGLKVFLFESHRSTPELSFAVRHLECDIGVMISASHNPPSDNGFKAYWSSGGQVLPPHDRGIIDAVQRAEKIPAMKYEQALAAGSIELIGAEVDKAYVAAVAAISLTKNRDVRALFTPLHGVGETSVSAVLAQAGFEHVEIFEPQRKPDGNFSNVPKHLPNPELTSAFEPAIQAAHTSGADLVLASDPDADRLGVAVRRRDGSFEHLTGNQVGALLVDYVLRKRSVAKSLSPDHFVCTTLVTTPMIRAVGEAANVTVVDDLLVGFKYIGQTIDARGPEKFLFGCEESLGYLAGTYARDKDAAVAALYVLELAADLKQSGKTLADKLDELYDAHGYFLEGQRSETCQGPRGKEQIDLLMRTLRENPPADLGGVKFARLRDYRAQTSRSIPAGGAPESLNTEKADMLFLDSAAGPVAFSIAVRPSGTEPKIKFYFFARARRSADEPLADTKTRAAATMNALQEALSAWVRKLVDAPSG